MPPKSKKSKKKIIVPKAKQTKVKAKEISYLGQALRSLGSIGGGALGTFTGIGPGVGSSAGHSLAASLSKWLGAGDYSLDSNSLVNKFQQSGSVPAMHSNNSSVVVRHKEYIGDVIATSSTAFSIEYTLPLNPGISASFPWLSVIASQYQEYTWKGLIFEYKSVSGESVSSSNTALGSIVMSTNYRATAAAPTSKQLMLNEFFSTDDKPSDDFCHPIECNPKENPYNVQYVRTGAVPAGEDQKTYDLGVTYLAISGNPGSTGNVLGELWATYEVELRKPVPQATYGANISSAHYQLTTTTTTNPFGTSRSLKFDNIGLSITNGGNIVFPALSAGNYLVNVGWVGATAGTSVTMTTATTGASVPLLWDSDTAPTSFGVGTANSVGVFTACVIIVPSSISTTTLSVAAVLTGSTVGDIMVTEINSNLIN
jgi:hypothetical protein